MLSAKQGNYWYHFYNVFGMTHLIGQELADNFEHFHLHPTRNEYLTSSICAD